MFCCPGGEEKGWSWWGAVCVLFGGAREGWEDVDEVREA